MSVPEINYDTPIGYSYDEARDLHIFAYRERVLPWWGLKNPGLGIPDSVLAALAGAVIGFVLFGGSFSIIRPVGAILGAVAGWYIHKNYMPKRPAPTKYTGRVGNDGVVTDFAAKVVADNDGNVELYREWLSQDRKSNNNYSPLVFPLNHLSSVERRTFAEVSPDSYESYNPDRYETGAAKQKARQKREAASNAQELILVFKDGQIIPIGWSTSNNDAAVAQSGLIQFFNQLGSHITERQTGAAHAATIGADDEAL